LEQSTLFDSMCYFSFAFFWKNFPKAAGTKTEKNSDLNTMLTVCSPPTFKRIVRRKRPLDGDFGKSDNEEFDCGTLSDGRRGPSQPSTDISVVLESQPPAVIIACSSRRLSACTSPALLITLSIHRVWRRVPVVIT